MPQPAQWKGCLERSSSKKLQIEQKYSPNLFAHPAFQNPFTARNVQRLRGGLVFKAHRLCVSRNSRLESNKEEAAEKSWSERSSSKKLQIEQKYSPNLFAHPAGWSKLNLPLALINLLVALISLLVALISYN